MIPNYALNPSMHIPYKIPNPQFLDRFLYIPAVLDVLHTVDECL